MEKVAPQSNSKIGILTSIVSAILLIVVGYYLYQFFVAPSAVKLDVPAVAYPRSSVFYRYSLQLNLLSTVFGGREMSGTDITAAIKKDMQRIKAAGFVGVKLGYAFQNNNSIADQIAQQAAVQGLYPIGMLGGSYSIPEGRTFTSAEMTQWQNYVRDEVNANKHIIYFWEIWGEPSLHKYGTPEEFVQLLRVTYPAIKKANPNAKVIVTLGADAKDSNFEDQVLALGGGDYFDILSIHPYGANPYLQEDLVKEAIAREQSVIANHNNQWPLVISEIGQPASEVGEAEQARLAQSLYTEAAKNNIPVTWFYWSDEHLLRDEMTDDGSNWGLIRYDGMERPMLIAIKEFLK